MSNRKFLQILGNFDLFCCKFWIKITFDRLIMIVKTLPIHTQICWVWSRMYHRAYSTVVHLVFFIPSIRLLILYKHDRIFQQTDLAFLDQALQTFTPRIKQQFQQARSYFSEHLEYLWSINLCNWERDRKSLTSSKDLHKQRSAILKASLTFSKTNDLAITHTRDLSTSISDLYQLISRLPHR